MFIRGKTRLADWITNSIYRSDIQSWDQTIHLQTIKFYIHVALKIVQSCDNISRKCNSNNSSANYFTMASFTLSQHRPNIFTLLTHYSLALLQYNKLILVNLEIMITISQMWQLDSEWGSFEMSQTLKNWFVAVLLP